MDLTALDATILFFILQHFFASIILLVHVVHLTMLFNGSISAMPDSHFSIDCNNSSNKWLDSIGMVRFHANKYTMSNK
jgi:hypothetical protein